MKELRLTDKQQAFAQHYAEHRIPWEAYRHAYDVAPETKHSSVCESASRLLKDPKIWRAVGNYEKEAVARAPVVATLAEMFAREVMIARADPRELMELATGNCRRCNGEGFGYRWRDEEYAEAVDLACKASLPLPELAGGVGFRPFDPPHPDCPECGGGGVPHAIFRPTADLSPAGRLLYRGIKQTRNGLEILTADQSKSAENVIRMLGGFKDNINLTGMLGIVAKVATLDPADPHAAARTYEDFLKAGAIDGGPKVV